MNFEKILMAKSGSFFIRNITKKNICNQKRIRYETDLALYLYQSVFGIFTQNKDFEF